MLLRCALVLLGSLLPMSALAASLIQVPTYGGTFYVHAVSGDGRVVAGEGNGGSPMLRWSNAEGFTPIADLPGSTGGHLNALSADGSVVVGGGNRPLLGREAFYWTESTGSVQLGDLAGGGVDSTALDVSADGSRIVGSVTSATHVEAAYWSPAGSLVPIGVLPLIPDSRATGVSADGAVIAGLVGRYVSNDQFNNELPFRWTQGEGMQQLDLLPGATSGRATAVSADGSAIVGRTGNEAVRWTDGGVMGLGGLVPSPLPPRSRPTGVSADGSVVVGWAINADDQQEAFLWDETNGMRSLQQVLLALGLDVADYHFIEAVGVSDDGTRIAGRMVAPAGGQFGFIALLPEPGTGILMGVGLALAAACRRHR